MQITHDASTGRITRIIEHNGFVITQVEQPNGEWWNIRIERKAQ